VDVPRKMVFKNVQLYTTLQQGREMGTSAFLEMIFESVYMGLVIMLGVVLTSVWGTSDFDFEITAFTVLILVQNLYVFNKVF
jgi:hypothetical protein